MKTPTSVPSPLPSARVTSRASPHDRRPVHTKTTLNRHDSSQRSRAGGRGSLLWSAARRRTQSSLNPAAVSDVVAQVGLGGANTFAAAKSATAAQPACAGAPAPILGGGAIAHIGRVVEADAQSRGGLVTRKIGKPYGEVREVVDTGRFRGRPFLCRSQGRARSYFLSAVSRDLGPSDFDLLRALIARLRARIAAWEP